MWVADAGAVIVVAIGDGISVTKLSRNDKDLG